MKKLFITSLLIFGVVTFIYSQTKLTIINGSASCNNTSVPLTYDGKTNTGSWTATANFTSDYIYVDLGANYNIYTLVVTFTGLSNEYYVRASTAVPLIDNSNTTFIGKGTPRVQNPYTTYFPGGQQYRYIKICNFQNMNPGEPIAAISEITIYSAPDVVAGNVKVLNGLTIAGTGLDGSTNQQLNINATNINAIIDLPKTSGGSKIPLYIKWRGDALTSSPFYIGTNGAIGIRTVSPDASAALTVKGKIVASEIEIKNYSDIIADFVFDQNYQLMSLEELNSYVTQNKHLPNVPSAFEMQNNGWNVVTMNNLLLQKVEELTLYVINQDEKIQEQEKKIEALQSELNKLNNYNK